MKLRPELLRFPLDDGGLEVIDLVLEQRHVFGGDEAAAIAALDAGTPPPAALAQRLERALLVEGATAALLRDGCRHGRTRTRLPAPAVGPTPSGAGPWELATALPGFVAAAWRVPERWRRLAEDRRAGRLRLRLDGFLDAGAATALRDRFDALPFRRHGAPSLADGEGHDLTHELDDVFGGFREGPLHALIGHVVDVTLPARIFLRAWRLGPDHDLAVHNDGVHYPTTFTLGLSEAWTAHHGGALAFGDPVATGLAHVERWLPHLGDLLLFVPTATAWHGVERVREGIRRTITGHYVAPSYPG